MSLNALDDLVYILPYFDISDGIMIYQTYDLEFAQPQLPFFSKDKNCFEYITILQIKGTLIMMESCSGEFINFTSSDLMHTQ